MDVSPVPRRYVCASHVNAQRIYRYVMLAAQSSFKGKSDRDKYEKAMRLKGCIGKIRADYTKNLKSKVTPCRTHPRYLCLSACALPTPNRYDCSSSSRPGPTPLYPPLVPSPRARVMMTRLPPRRRSSVSWRRPCG